MGTMQERSLAYFLVELAFIRALRTEGLDERSSHARFNIGCWM